MAFFFRQAIINSIHKQVLKYASNLRTYLLKDFHYS